MFPSADKTKIMLQRLWEDGIGLDDPVSQLCAKPGKGGVVSFPYSVAILFLEIISGEKLRDFFAGPWIF